MRGSIGDYQDSDEDALAKGLEAFETINRVLEDHEEATSPRAPQETPALVCDACLAMASLWRAVVAKHYCQALCGDLMHCLIEPCNPRVASCCANA